MSSTNSRAIAAFRRTVWGHWKKHGRHDLLWRKTRDPYRVLVSEMMLQQTQVPRVIPKYKEFLRAFPSTKACARAPLAEVLRRWSGLGYNRRAKYLHDAASLLARSRRVHKPAVAELITPGVGAYTKSAVLIFAFNEPEILIETNVRTAFIHHFFSKTRKKISDAELVPLVCKAAEGQDPRTWHWALMDYGAHLKQGGVRLNARSAHYTKQSKFEGSSRQLRGQILRTLAHGAHVQEMPRSKKILAALVRDGLVVKEKGKWRIT